MLHDLKFALRSFRRNPTFAAVAVAALALGLGANAAIFSVVDAVVLHPLPLPHPEQLVTVTNSKAEGFGDLVSWLDFADVREQSRSFAALAAYDNAQSTLTGDGDPIILPATTSTANLFAVLGVQPTLGRGFAPGEDESGRNHVVILTDQLWRQRFARDPNVLGRTITLDGEPYTVIGVAPPSLRFPTIRQEAGLFVPMRAKTQDAELRAKRRIRWLQVIGRLKPGVPVAQAQAELTTIQARLASAYPADEAESVIKVTPLEERLVGKQGPAMLLLFAAVGFVLLIACANVSNLLLARATVRQREIAIRASLGASRARIVRQLLTESTLLSVIGGGLGLVLAMWSVDGLIALIPAEVPRMAVIALDARVLAFTAVLSVATGVVFGLVPAVHAARFDLNEVMKGAGTSPSGRRARARSLLLIVEVALAMVLLVGAGLTLRSFGRLSRVDPGFDTRDVLTASVTLPNTRYTDNAAVVAFYRELEDRLHAIPGAQSSALSAVLPLSHTIDFNMFKIDSRPPPPDDGWLLASTRFVSPDYFKVMGMRIIRGRAFMASDDDPGADPTVVINERAAREFWPDEDPIGQRITIQTNEAKSFRIIGIVADVRFWSLAAPPQVEAYTPYALTPLPMPPSGTNLFVEVRGPHAIGLAGPLASAVRDVDPYVPITKVKTMEAYLADSLSRQRWSAVLLGIFGVLALVLAVVGVYGVMSYDVSQRTRDLGIRMALGARQGQILRMVLLQALRLTLAGVTIGTAAALALTRILVSQLQPTVTLAPVFGVHEAGGLYEISATDPVTFIAIAVLLTAVAMLACFLPARRATRVDPMMALQAE